MFSLSGKSKNQIPCFPCAVATLVFRLIKCTRNLTYRGDTNNDDVVFFSFLIFGGRQVIFVGPLIPLLRTSGDVTAGFQSQSGQPYAHLAEVCVLHEVILFLFKQSESKWGPISGAFTLTEK